MRRASSAGSVTVAAYSARHSTIERMSRMCTPSSSSSWSTFCSAAMPTILGIDVFHEFGGQLGDVLDELLRLDAAEQLGGVHLHQV